MEPEENENKSGTTSNTVVSRLVEKYKPQGMPEDDRGRMKLVVNNLVLHLHPSKVNARSLQWTYTWGLGGLSAILMALLGATGVILLNNYTPAAPQAYLDILEIRSNVWFGELIRNLHHWSANLLIIVAVLHLIRVFATGSYRPPRETNWIIGVSMLVLILGSNFTGYLLPWDQLAFWAITVGTSIISYIPFIGESLTRLVLAGPEVGAGTLLNFYSLHIAIIPLFIFGLMMYHFWRIRKDGGLTIPRTVEEVDQNIPADSEKVTTIPHLVQKEMIFALGWVAAIIIFAALVPAPLEGIADPNVSPNPAKAPWYFMGLQEMLLHFHPVVAALIIPGVVFTGVLLLPFYDVDSRNIGVYFRSTRGRGLSFLAAGLAFILTPAWVLVDEFLIDWSAWLPAWDTLITNGLVPLAAIVLPLILLDQWVKSAFKADTEERVVFIFVFLFTAFLILTIIGIFFRGPGMSMYLPWAMPAAH
ncbi:MAG TPA: cytochrome b N-terminal domain-containing protein [Anaerolineales bacterium]|nr:cytochrome b N-terminal domain-containing protein [Anaerolineales bacterium]